LWSLEAFRLPRLLSRTERRWWPDSDSEKVAVKFSFSAAILLAAGMFFAPRLHAEAKRLVLIKVDGLPAGLIERYAEQIDPSTRRSVLPSIHNVFVENGAWVRNFYVRGISLSAPSWSMLDTGRHLAIRGNADFDRFTPRVYDYLNFFPFYVEYARSRRVDMPAVETMDQFGVPLLIDDFQPEERFQSLQLFQRGVRWSTLERSLRNRVVRPVRELLNEWQTGFEVSQGVTQEVEREMVASLADPKILYLDYFSGEYDHTAHLTSDEASQLVVLKHLDALIGRLWSAVQGSPLASRTVFVIVSDHGMNSTPGIYSQGFNLVRFFNSATGGGHHAVTTRHPMTEYKIRGLDPFVSSVVTPSNDSLYLRDRRDYATALLDLDGNERASVQLRNSDLNAIHILLQQLARTNLDVRQRAAARKAVLSVIDNNRPGWSRTVAELNDELGALRRLIQRQQVLVASDQKKWNADDRAAGRDQEARRHGVSLETWRRDERGYNEYVRAMEHLLSLKESGLEPAHFSVDALLPKGVLGESNSIGQLRNYVAGLSPEGLVLSKDGSLDFDRTFVRVNYFAALSDVRVRNNVQSNVGAAPVDFTAVRVSKEALSWLAPEDQPDSDGVYTYGDSGHQALVLSRMRDGELWLRYLPVTNMVQDANGALRFTIGAPGEGFPLRMFEDPELQVSGDRSEWLSAWHSEREWFEAIHRTHYSNGLIGLHEYFQHWHPEAVPAAFRIADESDWPLLRRFATRRRELVDPDMLILASDHWNFNVRGFNPGGNHGSFFRISTHSVLMAAGAGIPAGLKIDRPYDSLSVVPTLLTLIGRLPAERRPKYPGPLIQELLPPVIDSAPR
jgi:hypothetical protein